MNGSVEAGPAERPSTFPVMFAESGTVDAAPTGSPSSRGAHFPFLFIDGFLRFLADNRNKLDLITYADLEWHEDIDGEGRYPDERRRWQTTATKLEEEGRAQVLLQHDVDARPHRTTAVVARELELGVPSSIMVFNRRVDRRHLKRTGVLRYTEYELDEELLKRAEAGGSIIGYHFNAMEQAEWEPGAAQAVFDRDLAELRTRYRIDFVSAHGGVRSPDGLKNRDLPTGRMAANGVRWVHNGCTPRFTNNYSDGGLNGTKIDPVRRDLRDFTRSIQPGGRYRILLHPQYYATPWEPAPGLEGSPWYDRLLTEHAADPAFDSWQDVRLSW